MAVRCFNQLTMKRKIYFSTQVSHPVCASQSLWRDFMKRGGEMRCHLSIQLLPWLTWNTTAAPAPAVAIGVWSSFLETVDGLLGRALPFILV